MRLLRSSCLVALLLLVPALASADFQPALRDPWPRSVTVYPDGGWWGNMTLQQGYYWVNATGTFHTSATDAADAECRLPAGGAPRDGGKGDPLQFHLEGWSMEWRGGWGACASSHRYSAVVSCGMPPTTTLLLCPASFHIREDSPGDNSGALAATVEPCRPDWACSLFIHEREQGLR